MYDDSYEGFRDYTPELTIVGKRCTIPDDDLKDWTWTLVRGNFTVEEIDGFLKRLNARYASSPIADRLCIIAQVFGDYDPFEIENWPFEEQDNFDRILQKLRKNGYGI
ncbi:MAG: hypothetical protein A2945_02910 [Candidatus Liptonbacteria bacterium RIFCSPLOWO2_01_FULL_52_25]|uniref:Uncharacterized protein n=1 Tax=Candidatus Liptonbacteria bacterium RIFCSPLOWO2_01_FULL_52_25 TaxID=1798650 RepID=A0A1G2CFY9_9BACT|nr:MAG: hypothetical protein A2945_02910 [Candidatus Liptonbacteria bacterium RIFCSPLOWO2_01_FULL_52_25]